MSWPRSTRRLARWPGGPRGIALLLAALLLGHGVAMAAEAAIADRSGAAQAAAALSLARPSPATPSGGTAAKPLHHAPSAPREPTPCEGMQLARAPSSVLGTAQLAWTGASAPEAPALLAGPGAEPAGPLPPRNTVRQALLQVFRH
jgi:hypothetical protein